MNPEEKKKLIRDEVAGEEGQPMISLEKVSAPVLILQIFVKPEM